MKVYERKRIAGSPHKKVKCLGCGELIWVHYTRRTAFCTSCEGMRGGICGQGGIRTDAGRGTCDCSHEVQYDGRCSC